MGYASCDKPKIQVNFIKEALKKKTSKWGVTNNVREIIYCKIMLEEISYLVMSTFTVWPVHTVDKFTLGMFVNLGASTSHYVTTIVRHWSTENSIIWLINKYTV